MSRTLKNLIKDQKLCRLEGLIGGEWLSKSSSGKVLKVENPATKEIIAELPSFGKEDTQKAIEKAQEAFLKWKA